MKIIILINPVSGGSRTDTKETIKACMKDLNIPVSDYVLQDTSPDNLVEQSCDAFRKADTVIGAGGDGTIHAVVEGYVKSGEAGKSMGIYPSGTGNDLCRHFGMYREFQCDPHDYLKRIIRGGTAEHSVWMIGDILFSNYFSIGYDAEVSGQFDRKRKKHLRKRGKLSNYLGYSFLGIKNILYKMDERIILNSGQRGIKARKVLIVSNITSYAGGSFLPLPDKGTVTCTAINSMYGYAKFMATRLTGRICSSLPCISISKGTLKHSGTGILQVDGEPYELKNMPGELVIGFVANINVLSGESNARKILR